MVVTKRKGMGYGEVEEGRRDQIYSDGKKLNFGWWAHSAIYRQCITELYTCNI